MRIRSVYTTECDKAFQTSSRRYVMYASDDKGCSQRPAARDSHCVFIADRERERDWVLSICKFAIGHGDFLPAQKVGSRFLGRDMRGSGMYK